ncbi:inactive tRNA-specific adenosine deaminase-like protein 3-like [Achlya hypogyna]|uniref:Inactive tRNA-specific adenosine deaminase-like protein 3-like n=1 Tax=Achlya hypogyna TaxID=1202772 RepID=A0A1V9YNE8_ACHHY|nr:inactive tRNA-specific adenosine deaminase-like protein 3-like [Achlya hypogyna]
MAAVTITEVEDPASGRSFEEKIAFHAIEFPAAHGSAVMKFLSATTLTLKDMGYGHLKRMKKAETAGRLLALVAPDASVLDAVIAALPPMEELVTSQVLVHKFAPSTKDEFARGNADWPMVFHPNAEVATTVLDDADEAQMQSMVARLLDIGTPATVANGCGQQSCFVVNPASGLVVASAADWTPSTVANPLMQHAAMQALEVVSTQDLAKSVADSYLCTNYDVYMAVEPCVMCSMALVHSRVRRVIYVTKNPRSGALGSCHFLHTQRSLNHRYRVFHATITAP